MNWFFIIMASISAIAGLLLLVDWKEEKGDYRTGEKRVIHHKAPTAVAILVLAFVPVFAIFSTLRIVPANTVGIPVTFGSIGREQSSGIHFVSPVTVIHKFSTRLQELTMLDKDDTKDDGDAIEVRGSDGYLMRVDTTIRYTVRQDSASELFRRVGSMNGIRDRIVRPEVREAVRIVFARYSAEDGYANKREQVAVECAELIQERLDKYGIDLDAVLVRNVSPDATLQQAIADRSAAREKALQATIEQTRQITEAETRKQVAERDAQAIVTKAQGEAQAAVVEANGKAEANKLVASSLSPLLNDYLRALALSTAQTIYVPADSSLLIGSIPK